MMLTDNSLTNSLRVPGTLSTATTTQKAEAGVQDQPN